MNTSNIFEQLLELKRIAVYSSYKPDALRVWLVRKFQDYKYEMNKLGFLDPDLEPCSLSMEWKKAEDGTGGGTATFYLRPRKVTTVQYTILPIGVSDES